MHTFQQFFACAVCVSLLANATAAVRGNDVRYVGGSISGIPAETDGELVIDEQKIMSFVSKQGSFNIAYEDITSIEYGQKAGRRIAVAILVTPLALLSKKRRHFLTLGYKDENQQAQGVVLELSKSLPQTLITVLEARSGLKCVYESEEARKHVHG
jgi:hypothetical protein